MNRRLLATLLVAMAVLALASSAARAQDPPPPPPTPPVVPGPGDPAPAAPNDAFAQPLTLSEDTSERIGDARSATAEAGEPAHAGVAAAHSVWFTYTAPATRTVSFDTCGSLFDTRVAVYTGATLGALVPVASDDDSSCGTSSRVTFAATAGTTYRIAVDGTPDDVDGTYRIQLDPEVHNDAERNAEWLEDGDVLTGSTVGATAEDDEPDHAGDAAAHSVWFQVWAAPGQPVLIDACTTSFDARVAVYAGGYGGHQEVGSSSGGCGTANGAKVRVTAPSYGYLFVALDGDAGGTGAYGVRALTNDDRGFPSTIMRGVQMAGSTLGATHESGEAVAPGAGGSVWYSIPAGTPGQQITVDTCGTPVGGGLDTLLTAYTSGSSPQQLATSDDELGCGPGGKGSRVTFGRPSGDVLVKVDGRGQGRFALRLTAPPANDDRANAQPVVDGTTFIYADNVDATAEAGEPAHAGTPAEHSIWFALPQGTTRQTYDGCTSPYSRSMRAAIYRVDGASLVEVARSATGCPRLSFLPEAGRSYLLAVDGTPGTVSIQKLAAPANDDFASAAPFSGYAYGSTTGATAEDGEPAHAGQPASRSVWYRATLPAGGSARAAVDACAYFAGTLRLAVYRGERLGDLTPVAAGSSGSSGCSSGARASWTRADRTREETVWIAVDGDAPFTLQLIGAPLNDDRAAEQDLYEGSTVQVDLSLATHESGERDHAGAGGSTSVWYRWQPYRTGPARVDTCQWVGSARTVVAVYRQTGETLTEVATGAPATGCASGGVAADWTAESGATYLVAIDAEPGRAGTTSVSLFQRPRNDDEDNATTLYGSTSYAPNVLATRETGEPAHAGGTGGRSLWWTWTSQGDGPVTFSACGTTRMGGPLDTQLAVYTGTGATRTPVAANDDAGGTCATGGSRVSFVASAGTTYQIAVDAAAEGWVSLTAPPRNDHFAAALDLGTSDTLYASEGTETATAEPSEPAHRGVPAERTVWWKWTAPRDGTAVLSTCRYGTDAAKVAVYTGTALAALTPVPMTGAGPCTGSTPEGERVRIRVEAGRTYRLVLTGGQGWTSLTGAMAPLNDDRVDATVIDPSGGSRSGSTLNASREAGEPAHGGAANGASVWFRWAPPTGRDAIIDACWSGFDVVAAVYEQGAGDALTPVATAPSGRACSRPRVRFRPQAGKTYLVAIDGVGGATGSYDVSFRAAPENDDRADATTISAPSRTYGTTVDADHEAGEPQHGGSGTTSVWYRFDAPRTGTITAKTCGAGAETALAAYGPDGARLAADATNARCGQWSLGSRIEIPVVAGETYELAVDAATADESQFALRLDPPDNDDFADAMVLTGAPAEAEGLLTAGGLEDGEPWYQDGDWSTVWHRWTAPRTETVEINTCGSWARLDVFTGTDVGALTPIGSDVDPECSGNGVELDVVVGTEYRIRVGGWNGDAYELQIAPPANDRPMRARMLTGLQDQAAGTLVGASIGAGEPWHAGGKTVWYRWTAPERAEVTVDACEAVGEVFVTAERRSGGGFVTGKKCDGSPGPGPKATFVTEAGQTWMFAVGNVSGGKEFTIAVDALTDTVPPETTLTSKPPALTNLWSVSLGFASDDPDARFECAIDGGSYTSCTSPRGVTPSEGTRTFAVRAIDRAGNVDPTPATWSYVVDRTPPVLTVTGGPAALTKETDASLAFTSDDANATVTCRVDGGGWSACSSPKVLSGLADGSHTFGVRGVDPAGNTGAEATRSWRVDTRPPVTSVTSTPASAINATTAQVGFTADESGSTYECATDDGAWATCSSPLVLENLAEGDHAVRVRATDEAGNTDATPAHATFRVDLTAPDTTLDEHPPALTNQPPRFAYSASEPGSRYECALDGATFSACSGPRTLSALADGAHTFRVRAIDAAGNTDASPAEHAFTYDTTPPGVVVDEEPGTAVRITTAQVGFHATEPGSTTACAVDGDAFTSCTSPWTTRAMAEGPHTLRIRATDPAGNEGAATTRAVVVDQTVPVTHLAGHPPALTRDESLTFSFGSSEPGAFECRMDDDDFALCTSPATFAGLADGAHRFEVVAIDAAGNRDATPAGWDVRVDRTAPRTTIHAGPAGPVHRDARFTFSANEAATFQCAYGDRPWFGCASGERMPEIVAGTHELRVRAIDEAGNVETEPATRSFTIEDAAPSATLALDGQDGQAPFDVAAAVGGTDPDGDPLTYRLSFGDGAAVQSGTLPVGERTHTYVKEGVHLVHLVVSDGVNETSRTAQITVSPPEPLAAAAGDDQQAEVGKQVQFDASASRPGRLIDAYRWTFGDGDTATGVRPRHVFTTAGTYEVTLTTEQDGETDTDTATVTVSDPPPAEGLDVHVTGGGQALAGADVMVIAPDGKRFSAGTDGSGDATLQGLPDGAVAVYAWADGFRPKTATATLSRRLGEVTIDLEAGEAGAATLESHRMTLEEIEAAGIDVSDPENYHVYEAEIHLYFDPDEDPPVEPIRVAVSKGGLTCLSDCGGGGGSGGSGGGGGTPTKPCEDTEPGSCWVKGDHQFIPQVQYVGGKPFIHWLVLPMRASWLKEFFDVQLVVQNLAEGFTFGPGVADLPLPKGLSLVALHGEPQQRTQSVGPIAGGKSRSVNWIVRGDVEGEYDLEASYAAVVDPINVPVAIRARTRDKLKVWGASALKTTIRVDEKAVRWGPYGFEVEVENVSPVPIYNMQIEMLDRPRDADDETQAQFFYAPAPAQVQGTATIEPGKKFVADYTVFAGLGDDEHQKLKLLLEKSFVRRSGGDVDLKPLLTTRSGGLGPAAGPVNADINEAGTAVDITWAPIANPPSPVVGYELYTRQSLTGGIWEPYAGSDSANDRHVKIGAHERALGRYYAVGTRFADGRVRFLHRIGVGPSRYVSLGDSFSAGEGVPVFEPATDEDGNSCHRSARGSYGRRLVEDPATNGNLEPSTFRACSGAVAQDVHDPNPGNADEPAQASQVNGFTDVISMSMGGNDIGFADLAFVCAIQDCTAQSGLASIIGSNAQLDFLSEMWDETSPIRAAFEAVDTCANPVSTAKKLWCAYKIHKVIKEAREAWGEEAREAKPKFAYNGILHDRLVSVYTKLASRAPNAHVYLQAYPNIVKPGGITDVCDLLPNVPGIGELHYGEQAGIARLINDLNGAIQGAANAANQRLGRYQFEMVSSYDEFEGHELCRNGTLNSASFINPIVNPFVPSPGNDGPVSWSVHPNAQGQQAYATALRKAINNDVGRSIHLSPRQEASAGTLFVPYGARTVRAAASWPGSTVTLKLVSPSGTTYTVDSDGVRSGTTATSQWLEVDDPAPGTWNVKVFGDDVHEDEPVHVTATAEEPAPAGPPTAQITHAVTSTDKRTIDLTATGGPAGATYRWTFSDETQATGREVQHRFPARGARWASLEIVPADGVSGFAGTDLPAPDETPPAVTLTAPVDGLATNDPKPSFAGAAGRTQDTATTAADRSTVTVKVWTGTTPAGTPLLTRTTTRGSDGAWSVVPADGLEDGTYTVRAEQEDEAENVGHSVARTFKVDTTAPAPAITVPAADAATNDTTPTVRGTAGREDGSHASRAADAGTVTVALWAGTSTTGTPARTATAERDDDGTWSIDVAPALAERTWTARATQHDGAGNEGPSEAVTFTVDTTAPDTAIDAGPSGATRSSSPSFTFSSETGARFACRLDQGAWQQCSSPHGYTGVADGAHTFAVRATDAAGNEDQTVATQAFSIDTIAPVTKFTSGPSGPIATTSATFGFAAEPGAQYACRLDAGAWAPCTSPHTLTGLAEGSHELAVRATDAAGNPEVSEVRRAIVVDTTAPVAALDAGPAGTVATATVAFTFSGEAGALFDCRLDQGTWERCASPKTYSGLGNGAHTFSVRAVDAAGNVGPATGERAFTVTVPVTPPAGNVGGGTEPTPVPVPVQPTPPAPPAKVLGQPSKDLIKPVVAVAGATKLAVKSAAASLMLAPFSETVSGTVTVVSSGKVAVPGVKGRKVIAVASGSFRAPAGQRTALRLRLSSAAKKVLQRRSSLVVNATISATDTAQNTTDKVVTLTLVRARR